MERESLLLELRAQLSIVDAPFDRNRPRLRIQLDLAPASPEEVERVLWVPLAELVRPDTYRVERWGEPPNSRLLYFYELDDETVWGATGSMLRDLLRRLA